MHPWLRTSHSATGGDSALRANSLSLCLLPVVNAPALTKGSWCVQRFRTPGIGSIESPSSRQRVDITETTTIRNPPDSVLGDCKLKIQVTKRTERFEFICVWENSEKNAILGGG